MSDDKKRAHANDAVASESAAKSRKLDATEKVVVLRVLDTFKTSMRASWEHLETNNDALALVKDKHRELMSAWIQAQKDCATMQIFAKTLSGRTVTLDVRPDNTVEDLKWLIYFKDDMLPSRQRLVYGGKQLEDNQTVRDTRIQADSTLHIIGRIRGC